MTTSNQVIKQKIGRNVAIDQVKSARQNDFLHGLGILHRPEEQESPPRRANGAKARRDIA
jgi:hypothetical protein